MMIGPSPKRRASNRSTWFPTARRSLGIVEPGREKQGRAQPGIVNRANNLALQATSDVVQHSAVGVWSSPLATFRSGKGDCKDYATSNFAALLLAGVRLKISAS
jgi:predicted transglutaminase-like cysteine proteinase